MIKRFLIAAVAALCFASAAEAAGIPANTVMVTPANPTGPASTTAKMSGVGISNEFTPHYDGVAIISISGVFSNNTAGDGATAQIVYGTGTAPSNAGTFTGTACGNLVTTQNSSLTGSVSTGIPFSVTCIATGLALNTGYWIDIAAAQVTGGTVTMTNITVSAAEL